MPKGRLNVGDLGGRLAFGATKSRLGPSGVTSIVFPKNHVFWNLPAAFLLVVLVAAAAHYLAWKVLT